MREIKYLNTSLHQKCRGLMREGGVFAGHYDMYVCYTGFFFS